MRSGDAERAGAEASVPLRTPSPMWPSAPRSSAEAFSRMGSWSRGPARTPSARDELRLARGRSRGLGALRGGASGRAGLAASKSPSRVPPTEVGRPLEGTLGVPATRPLAEARWPVSLSLESCLVLPFHRGGARVRDTQCGKSTTPPLGFGPLRRLESRRSLCRFTSSAPSALRVSHPLSGLSPPGPRGFVSRHIHPWGFVTAFRAFPTQPAVTPFDAPCSHALSADSSPPRASSRVTFAPVFFDPVSTLFSPFAPTMASRTTSTYCLDISSVLVPTEVGASPRERSIPQPGRSVRVAHRGADGSHQIVWRRFRQARACDFRALLRPKVRTRALAVRRAPEPMLS